MDDTPVRWCLVFLIPLFVFLSFYFLYLTFPIAPAAGEPDILKPEWYTLTTARGVELFYLPCVLGGAPERAEQSAPICPCQYCA